MRKEAKNMGITKIALGPKLLLDKQSKPFCTLDKPFLSADQSVG